VMSNYGYKIKSVPVIFEPPCISGHIHEHNVAETGSVPIDG
jgi:hypothetical protein